MSGFVHLKGIEGFEGRSSYRTKVDNHIIDRLPLVRLEGNAYGNSREGEYARQRYEDKDISTIESETSRFMKRPPYNVLRNDCPQLFIGKKNVDIQSFKGKLGGFIFMCNRRTLEKSLLHRSFEMPLRSGNLLDNAIQRVKMFFFELEERKLFGVFEITSSRVPDIVFKATGIDGDSFSIQVQFRVLKLCSPLQLKDFEDVIRENYCKADCFTSELNPDQVSKLLRLYHSEVPHKNYFTGKATQLSPVFSGSYSLIDPQQPHLQLEGFPEKYVEESHFLGKESSVPDLSNHKSHMYSDGLSPSNYSNYPYRTDCLIRKFKGSLGATPSAAEDNASGSASVCRHPFISSSCEPLDVFGYKRIQAASMVNGVSLSSAERSIDWKVDLDCLDSNYTSKLDIHTHVPSNSESADAVAYLQRLYSSKLLNVNDSLDDRKCAETRISNFAKSHGYKLQKACTCGDMDILTSTGYKLSHDDSIAFINSQFGNSTSPHIGGGISMTHSSPGLIASHAHHACMSSNITKTEQAVSMAHFATVLPQISEAGQVSSRESRYQPGRDSRNLFLNYSTTDENELLTSLPLLHACKSMMLNSGTVDGETAPHIRNGNQSAYGMEKYSNRLQDGDGIFFRSSQRDNSPTLISRATIKPEKVVKGHNSDSAGPSGTDAATREQNYPVFPNTRFPREFGRKKQSVWSRLSGLERSSRSPTSQGDVENEAMDHPFALNRKDVRGSLDVSEPHNLEDNVDKLNVDFSFREKAFIVNFKLSKSKFHVNEVNAKDGGQGTIIGGPCSSGTKNMRDSQIRKRRKIIRPEFFG